MDTTLAVPQSELQVRQFVSRVYAWMTFGLVVTGCVAGYMGNNPDMIVRMVRTPFLFLGLILAEFAAVWWLSARVKTMTPAMAGSVFTAYSALNGVTLSVIFIVYTRSSINNAFFVTAGTFGVTALYGYSTQKDLTELGSFCFMGLIGLILASLVNWFLKSPAVEWATTYIGILVFVGLTAYDAQKVKSYYVPADEGTDRETAEAIGGALALYLDFVNLFLYILRVMGKRRD